MRGISLWQPHASLWLSVAKVHETRGWATKYRGPLLVHAAKRIVTQVDSRLNAICVREFGSRWMFDLPLGALIGKTVLTDCCSTDNFEPLDMDDYICGDFTPGRFAWRRGTIEVFPRAIPFRGKQGFFNVPDELVPR